MEVKAGQMDENTESGFCFYLNQIDADRNENKHTWKTMR